MTSWHLIIKYYGHEIWISKIFTKNDWKFASLVFFMKNLIYNLTLTHKLQILSLYEVWSSP